LSHAKPRSREGAVPADIEPLTVTVSITGNLTNSVFLELLPKSVQRDLLASHFNFCSARNLPICPDHEGRRFLVISRMNHVIHSTTATCLVVDRVRIGVTVS
jgi:hypothetical protein